MTTGYDRGHGLGATCISGSEVCIGINSDPIQLPSDDSGWASGSGGGILGGTNVGIPGPVVSLSWMFLLAVAVGAYVFIKVTD